MSTRDLVYFFLPDYLITDRSLPVSPIVNYSRGEAVSYILYSPSQTFGVLRELHSIESLKRHLSCRVFPLDCLAGVTVTVLAWPSYTAELPLSEHESFNQRLPNAAC